MALMFQGAGSLDIDVAQWDVSQLQNAESMFEGAYSFTGQGIGEWSTGSLTSMKSMFKYVGDVGDVGFCMSYQKMPLLTWVAFSLLTGNCQGRRCFQWTSRSVGRFQCY